MPQQRNKQAKNKSAHGGASTITDAAIVARNECIKKLRRVTVDARNSRFQLMHAPKGQYRCGPMV
jgi:hypothetical protein